MRNLKAVLSMREQLNDNQVGRIVNGRTLKKPVPLRADQKKSCQSLAEDIEMGSLSPSNLTKIDNQIA